MSVLPPTISAPARLERPQPIDDLCRAGAVEHEVAGDRDAVGPMRLMSARAASSAAMLP